MGIRTTCYSLLAMTLCVAIVAQADVSSFQASASSSIVQYYSGVEQQRDVVSKTYPDSSASAASVPIEARHALVGKDSGNQVNWTAFNRVITNDPQYNADVPRDFIMETAVGSADSNVMLKVKSTASQTRHINLLPSEFSELSSGDAVNLVSKFSLQGALAGIVPISTASAEGLQIKCNLKILKNDTPVWDGTVDFAGRSDKTFSATTTGDFLDSDFVLAQNDLPDLARIGLVVFDKDIPYSYSGTVGDSFDLTAVMDLEYTVPGGLGAGCAFGTVPSEMITLTQDLFGDQADPIINSAAGETIIAPAAAETITSSVPEPISLVLLLVGGLLMRRR